MRIDTRALRRTLAVDLGSHDDDARAATALVIGGPDDDQHLLVIERVARDGDPWSGDMALPGGRRDDGEALATTAARETREETGVELPEPFARLPDTGIRVVGGSVATFLFRLDGLPTPVPEPAEVADAFWLPMARLFDPDHAVRHRAGPWGVFDGIAVDHDADGSTPPRVLWGLTLTMLDRFAEAVGTPLATRP